MSPTSSPSASPSKPGALAGLLVGRYQLLHRIASGGMATVYVARAVSVGGFERLLAVKALHADLSDQEEFVAMFLDEARLAAQIHHPNVVATLDVLEAHGRYFLAMDYVEGLELGALLRRAAEENERIPHEVVARIMLDVLQGLSAAHSLTDRGGRPLHVVHRDVSPQNILVGVDGITRLTDFGVAKAEHRLSSTRDGGFKGKIAYAAPEQLTRSLTDQRSDLFSFGVVLWESLTGSRLFRGDDKYGVVRQILEDPIPLVSEKSAGLEPFDEAVSAALEREREKRAENSERLLFMLEEATRNAGGAASPALVSRWVRRLGARKLGLEAEGIRNAEAAMGTDPPSLSPEQAAEVSTEAHSLLTGEPRPRSEVSRTTTVDDPVDLVDAPRNLPRWRWWILGPLLAALAIVMTLVAFELFHQYERPSTRRPQPPNRAYVPSAPRASEARTEPRTPTASIATAAREPKPAAQHDASGQSAASSSSPKRPRRARRPARPQTKRPTRAIERPQTERVRPPSPSPPAPWVNPGGGSQGGETILVNPYQRNKKTK